MVVSQSVPHPCGVAVLGTATLQVPPDFANVRCGVSRNHDDPSKAFEATREAARSVRRFLDEAGVQDIRSSRVKLDHHYELSESSNRRVQKGYAAELTFEVVVRELDTLEAVLAGIIEHGVNDLQSTTFGTSELAAERRRARVLAMAAARGKAELYAGEAGRTLGEVLHIEDSNPDALQRREGMHVTRSAGAAGPGAVDPGSITVGAAVHVTYAWAPQE